MKNLCLLLLVLWVGFLPSTMAQSGGGASTPPADSVRQYLDNMFANVNKAQVPTPYLEEYGLRFAPLRLFNGILQDSNRTTADLWRLLYASVLSGNINGPCTLPTLPDLNATLKSQQRATSAIPILIERLDYARLRPDAITAGLLTGQDDQLFDVPGRGQSPYQTRTLFAAAPAQNNTATGDVAFVFTPALHLQSGGGSLSSIQLDFGDGRGYLPATWNQPLTANYCSAGLKRIRVKVTYAQWVGGPSPEFSKNTNKTGSIVGPGGWQYASYESHFDLEVRTPGCATASRYDADMRMVPFAPRPEHSGAKVYIRYGGPARSRTQLVKPLIVAEGYDPSSVAPKIQENYTINDFLTAVSPTVGFNLYNALEDAGGVNGYDIVFIDYNNGTDDIRRNAALFEEVVRWVNANKVGGTSSGQRNVVLGISMGGLIARYGLAEMEKRGNDPTHTRLLLTHDSPHRGANTPLGVQALTRQAAGSLAGQFIRIYNSNGWPVFFPQLSLFPVLQQADDLLDAPATKQLLLVRATRSLVGPLSQFGHEFNSFVDNEYRSMITPNPGQVFSYDFRATSLGSQCGRSTLNPYSELIRLEGEGYLTNFLTSTGYHTEVIVNALPNGGEVRRISGLRIWQQVRVLIFSRRIYLTRFDYHSPASNRIAWDGLPGGTQQIAGQLDITPGSGYGWRYYFPLPFVMGYSFNIALANDFCFVPIASALDVPILDNTTLTASYINSLTTSPSLPRATNFIAQASYPDFVNSQWVTKYNFEHPRFPSRQAQWLYNEMERTAASQPNPLTCSNECLSPADLRITGPGTLCGSGTYSSPVTAGAGATYSWTARPASAFTNSSGTGPTFTTANSGNSSGTITLVVGGNCPLTLTKSVKVGAPEAPVWQELVPLDGCANLIGSYRVTNYDPDLTYQATSTGSVRVMGGVDTDGRFNVKGGGYGGTITISVTNGCGRSSTQQTFTFTSCESYSMSPNPASSEVQVSQESTAARGAATDQRGTGPASPGIEVVRLYDNVGQLRLEQPGQNSRRLRVLVSQLPTGLYLVHIVSGGRVASRQHLQITR